MSEQAKTTIVFAHGLWADGSCYSKVIPHLLADGFQVMIWTGVHRITAVSTVTNWGLPNHKFR